ncbi:hypothetical protein FOZ62_003554, partial [Perkinsus olseni]
MASLYSVAINISYAGLPGPGKQSIIAVATAATTIPLTRAEGFPPLRVTYLSLTDNGAGCLFNNSISGKSTTGALEVKVGRAGVPHMLSIVCPANSGEDGFLSTFSEAGVLDTYERGYPKWRAEDRFRFEDPPLVGTGLDPLGGINSATLLEEMGDLNWAAIEINRKPSWKGKHSVDDDVIRAQGPTEAKTADGLGK